jgi:predicted nuclease of restriction endonuclease-like (RecB) superfamily
MTGLAERNLRYMRDLARTWPDHAMLPQAVAKLPWGHVRCLLDKFGDNRAAQTWYAERAVAEGWSRRLLEHHVATRRYEREGAALSNFESTLPAAESKLVQQILQEDYSLQFLGLTGEAKEAELERSLVAEIERFMLELGAGFAFVGRQVRIEVGGEEFFIDMLFFHIHLNRYVVIELKLGRFRPEHAGQINFYVNAVDRQLREERHGATIGLVLCASRNRTIARYALEGIDRPVGVARYDSGSRELVAEVPKQLHGCLPELDRISAGVQEIIRRHENSIDGSPDRCVSTR